MSFTKSREGTRPVDGKSFYVKLSTVSGYGAERAGALF